jgi:hypothetical protein
MDEIKKLQSEVAALHMFVISLLDALPEDVAAIAHREFTSNYGAVRAGLVDAGLNDSATRLDEAVEALNGRSVFHLRR